MKKVKGLSKEKKNIQIIVQERKGVGCKWGRAKGGINGVERDLTLGGERMMQGAGDVL